MGKGGEKHRSNAKRNKLRQKAKRLISEGKMTREVMEVTGYSRGWIQQLARR